MWSGVNSKCGKRSWYMMANGPMPPENGTHSHTFASRRHFSEFGSVCVCVLVCSILYNALINKKQMSFLPLVGECSCKIMYATRFNGQHTPTATMATVIRRARRPQIDLDQLAFVSFDEKDHLQSRAHLQHEYTQVTQIVLL